MSTRLGGHGLQLLGFAVVFQGLACVAAALFTASRYPAVPTWAFALGGAVLGVPLMIAGGRVNAWGRGQVLGVTPETAREEYHRQNVLLAAYLGILLAQSALVASPLLLCAVGLASPTDPLVSGWVVGWMLVLCVGRRWITRPLWRAAGARILMRRAARQSTNH